MKASEAFLCWAILALTWTILADAAEYHPAVVGTTVLLILMGAYHALRIWCNQQPQGGNDEDSNHKG